MIMMSTLFIGISLLLVLLLFAARGFLTAQTLDEGTQTSDRALLETYPQEFTHRLFSSGDWKFVSKTGSPGLKKLFKRERKAVALLWVRQTAAGIQDIMQEHAGAARTSHDLEITTETKLFLQYALLMFICGLLFAAVQLFGPIPLGGLALYLERLSHQLREAQQAFKDAANVRPVRAASSM